MKVVVALNCLNLAELVVNELIKRISKKMTNIPFSIFFFIHFSISLLNLKISRAYN